MPTHIRYVIITPVRDEEAYIHKTLESVASQTILPIEWIIVNDGSTDRTGEIADQQARKNPWIKVIHTKNRGFRQAGTGVIDAFYEGYRTISQKDWEFVVKLDGDLSFQPDYFEASFRQFAKNARLGIGGGMIYNLVKGELQWERHPMFHVRGATKIYRRECWNDIGGLMKAPGWDTLDEVKANMFGWQTQSFLGLRVVHHRFTGSADGTWRNFVKNGLANYISGYHPIFMAVKCMKRLFQKPYIVGALGLLDGFITGYVKNIPQVPDEALIHYLRQQQLKRIFLKQSIWK
ncbi:MAG: glycosyltransferase family 2 protein [Syntrophales bacterium]